MEVIIIGNIFDSYAVEDDLKKKSWFFFSQQPADEWPIHECFIYAHEYTLTIILISKSIAFMCDL